MLELNKIYEMDCLEGMKQIDSDCIDLIVTDPPYALTTKGGKGGFMGKKWDSDVPSVDIWKECLRVLKPGAFSFVMCIPRQDSLMRMLYRLDEAGFDVDFTSLYHCFASGFPKSSNISKMVDKKPKGYERIKEFSDFIKNRRLELNISKTEADNFICNGSTMYSFFEGRKNKPLYFPNNDHYAKMKELFKLDSSWDSFVLETNEKIIGEVDGDFGYQKDMKRWNKKYKITETNTIQAKSLDGSYAGFQPKPALELIIRAQKPSSIYTKLTITISQAITLMDDVIQWSNANIVKTNLSQYQTLKEFIVQSNVTGKTIEEATIEIGKVGGQFDQMDISKSILEMRMGIQNTNWNTGLLWKSILVEVLSRVSKFTTKMAAHLIIELKTLNSYLSATIQDCIIQAEIKASGVELNVNIVESILKSVLIKSLSQKETTAQENVLLNFLMNQEDMEYANIAIKNSSGEVNQSKESSAHLNAIGTTVVLVAMKPLSEKTYVNQALKNKKGITWLSDCRIPYQSNKDLEKRKKGIVFDGDDLESKTEYNEKFGLKTYDSDEYINKNGRFPGNLLISDDILNDGKNWDKGGSVPNKGKQHNLVYGEYAERPMWKAYNDSGSFSRYFDLDRWFTERFKKLPEEVQKTFPFLITPKPSVAEKNKGLEEFEEKNTKFFKTHGGTGDPSTTSNTYKNGKPRPPTMMKNIHPTCKSIQLMNYLITLGSRKNDIILDPFVGSGTTCIAAKMLSRKFIGMEINSEYVSIAKSRLKSVLNIDEWI